MQDKALALLLCGAAVLSLWASYAKDAEYRVPQALDFKWLLKADADSKSLLMALQRQTRASGHPYDGCGGAVRADHLGKFDSAQVRHVDVCEDQVKRRQEYVTQCFAAAAG